MNSITSTLSTLRKFPGWQDAGQVGEDKTLVDDTLISIREDGSVGTDAGGVLVYSEEVDQEWLDWLAANDLLAEPE